MQISIVKEEDYTESSAFEKEHFRARECTRACVRLFLAVFLTKAKKKRAWARTRTRARKMIASLFFIY